MTLFDKQHNEIVLGDEISRGGEGVVYSISDNEVAKIFFEPEPRFEKINAFIRKNINHPHVCTPKDLLYDENNKFVGYTMS